jgi:hypothetical protein
VKRKKAKTVVRWVAAPRLWDCTAPWLYRSCCDAEDKLPTRPDNLKHYALYRVTFREVAPRKPKREPKG